MPILSIDTNSLTFEQAGQVEYLSVLAKFNQLKAEWLKIAKMNGTVKRGMPKYLVELGEEVQAMAPDWRLRAWPLSEISRKTKVPIATLRRWANEGSIRSEKRGRDWYVSLDDVENMSKKIHTRFNS